MATYPEIAELKGGVLMPNDTSLALEDLQRDRDAEKAHLHEPLFRPFKQSSDPDSIFNVSLPMGNDWDTYALGYKLAADNLVETMPSSPVFLRDALAYPILFLYRHYFELRLKELLHESCDFLDMPADIPLKHDLMRLWSTVRPNVESILPSQHFKADNDAIQQRLAELSALDPKSLSFRYPSDPVEKAHSVNMSHIKQVVQAMSDILDTFSAAISQYLDWKHETMSEPPMA